MKDLCLFVFFYLLSIVIFLKYEWGLTILYLLFRYRCATFANGLQIRKTPGNQRRSDNKIAPFAFRTIYFNAFYSLPATVRTYCTFAEPLSNTFMMVMMSTEQFWVHIIFKTNGTYLFFQFQRFIPMS